jgi:hypothetical protein
MARKSRRARRKRASRATAPAVTTPSPVETGAEARGPRGGSTTAQAFSEQYAHVYGDLKRIGVLAGVLFAVLVALSFVIR